MKITTTAPVRLNYIEYPSDTILDLPDDLAEKWISDYLCKPYTAPENKEVNPPSVKANRTPRKSPSKRA